MTLLPFLLSFWARNMDPGPILQVGGLAVLLRFWRYNLTLAVKWDRLSRANWANGSARDDVFRGGTA